MVIEREGRNERAMDIFSRMLDERIVFFTGPMEDGIAQVLCSQLLYLDSKSNDDIHLYINSPGGVVTSGLCVYDTMQLIKADVATYVLGHACSMGSFLAQAGAPGKRFVAPHSRTMIHDPSGGARGIYSDFKIQVEEMEYCKKVLTEGYVRHNSKGKTKEFFDEKMARDHFLNAEQAIDYGLADEIMVSKKAV